jgi:Sulfate transporter CysZ/Etoposide-induced protein 2.4
MFDAFWRAVAYCLHPRLILWSLLPLLLAGGAVALLGWTYWEPAVAAVRATLEQWALTAAMLQWLDTVGANQLRTLVGPMIVVALAVPVLVLLSLLLVATLMTPAIVRLVAARRFPQLEMRRGASGWQSLGWALVCTAAAMLALLLSVPLWLVPPLVLVLPPLIWGWLTCRILAFDTLALHASVNERLFVLRRHRWALLFMGIVCGYLGALPSMMWALSAATLIFAPLLVLVSVWLYTLVFAFAALWFAHFTLAELQRLRHAEARAAASAPAPTAPLIATDVRA